MQEGFVSSAPTQEKDPFREQAGSDRILRFAGIFFLLCALLSNVGLFCITDPSYLPFFTEGAMGWIAAGMLFVCARHVYRTLHALPKVMLISWGILLILFLIHLFTGKGTAWDYLHLPGEELTLLALPLLFCCCFTSCQKIWIKFGAFLWGFNLLMIVLGRCQGRVLWKNGICGNENWSAALLVMGSLFVFLFFEEKLRSGKSRQILLWSPVLLSVAVSFLIGSKGTILCAVCCAGFFLFLQGGKKRRALLAAALFAVLLAGGVFAKLHTERVQEFLTNDARPSLYLGACSLVREHWMTGTGHGGFENEFMEHRPLEYFFVFNPAPRSNHPHNHLLLIAGAWGAAGLLCWLVLLGIPLFKTARKLYRHEECSPMETVCFFVLLYALLHGCLDLIMEVWPTWILALTALGGLWHFRKEEQERSSGSAETDPRNTRQHTGAILCFLIAGICFYCGGSIAFRALYARKQLEKLRKGSMSRNEAITLIRETAQKCPGDYHVNFSFMTLLERKIKDPRTTLFVSSLMLQGNIPNYPGVRMGRGNALMALGRFREAWECYRQEALLFPMTLRPVYNMVVASRAMRDFALAKNCEQILLERMRIRKLSGQDLQKILRGESILDLRAGHKP